MFPLYEETIFYLALLMLGLVVAVFSARATRINWRIVAVVAVCAVSWPWLLVLFFGFHHYLILAALYFGGGTLTAILAGIIWDVASRRLATGSIALALAVLPSLVVGGTLLERQRVPNAACAEQVVFQVGSLNLIIPRDIGVRSSPSSDDPPQKWQGAYSEWPGAKPSVRLLCKVTDGGQEPLRVSHLFVPVSWFSKLHGKDCEAGSAPADLKPYCTAIARTRVTIVHLYRRADGLPGNTLGHFSRQKVVASLSDGAESGFRCNTKNDGSRHPHCTIWLRLASDVLAVASAYLNAPQDDEDPVTDTSIVLNAMLQHLGTTPHNGSQN